MVGENDAGLRGPVAKHPLVRFLVLCFALSWALESPLVLSLGSVSAQEGPNP